MCRNLIYMSNFYLKALLNFASVFLLFTPVAARMSPRYCDKAKTSIYEQSLKTMRLEIEELA